MSSNRLGAVNRGPLIRLVVAAALSLCCAGAFGDASRNLTALYDDAELERWRPVLERLVVDIFATELIPSLDAKDRQALGQTKVKFPLRSDSGNPLDFYAIPATKEIYLPVLSLKWHYDLLYSEMWLACNGYVTTPVPLYINMLKYRSASEFPARRYPKPFATLGIPQDSTGAPVSSNPNMDRHFLRSYRGMLLFILSHEVGHIALSHVGPASIENERTADVLAIQTMSRARGDMVSIMHFFLYASFWTNTRSDFNSDLAYYAYLFRSRHPYNSERLTRAAETLRTRPKIDYPELPETHDLIVIAKQMGDQITEIAKDFGRLNRSDEYQELARTTQVSDLAPIRTSRSRPIEGCRAQ